jgi:hypothetical protein
MESRLSSSPVDGNPHCGSDGGQNQHGSADTDAGDLGTREAGAISHTGGAVVAKLLHSHGGGQGCGGKRGSGVGNDRACVIGNDHRVVGAIQRLEIGERERFLHHWPAYNGLEFRRDSVSHAKVKRAAYRGAGRCGHAKYQLGGRGKPQCGSRNRSQRAYRSRAGDDKVACYGQTSSVARSEGARNAKVSAHRHWGCNSDRRGDWPVAKVRRKMRRNRTYTVALASVVTPLCADGTAATEKRERTAHAVLAKSTLGTVEKDLRSLDVAKMPLVCPDPLPKSDSQQELAR